MSHYRSFPAASGAGDVPDRQRELQRSDRAQVARVAARAASQQARAALLAGRAPPPDHARPRTSAPGTSRPQPTTAERARARGPDSVCYV